MPLLPLEIIVDILCRLPVKSLKRFRCVSKWLDALIGSDYFVKLHLRHSKSSNSNGNLILGGLALYSIDLGSLVKAEVIRPSFYYKSVDNITSSCNGLVVVTSEPPVLWNPFSRNYKILAASGDENTAIDESYSKIAYGFGHDSINDDYKVVRVVEFRNKSTHTWIRSEVKIFGTKSNSWKRVDNFPYPLPFLRGKGLVLVNRALHTMVEYLDHLRTCEFVKIMAFSVETEKHYEVAMPQGSRICRVNAKLDVIGDCLSIVCVKLSQVVVWIMKEYGQGESWTKLLSIRPPHIEPGDFVKPLVYVGNGDKVLLNCADKRLSVYDLRNKTLDNVSVDGLPFMFYAETCVESLVWIDTPDEVKKCGVGKKKSFNKNRDDFLSEGFKLVL